MSTVAQIVDAGFGFSFQNRPHTIATHETELVGVVNRKLSEIFINIAPENPTFFGTALPVAFGGGGWTIPSNAELIWKLTNPAGADVIAVPFDDLTAEPLKPAVYQRGNMLLPAGNVLDPTSGSLTFFYSRESTPLTALTDSLDALWPEKFDPILILDLAGYLADKDNRPNEGAAWRADAAKWEAMLMRRVGMQLSIEVRRMGFPRRSVTKRTAPALGTSKVG